jgi:hypothetical protein
MAAAAAPRQPAHQRHQIAHAQRRAAGIALRAAEQHRQARRQPLDHHTQKAAHEGRSQQHRHDHHLATMARAS